MSTLHLLSSPLRKGVLVAAMCAALPVLAAEPSYHLRIKVEGLQPTTTTPVPPKTDVPATPTPSPTPTPPPTPAPAPRLVMASAATESFGSTQVGKTAVGTLSYAIRNEGNAVGSLSGLAPAGNHPQDFMVASTCDSIPAGATCNVTVSFKPTAAGDRIATLSLLGSAYPLRGYGSEPVGDGVSRTGACAGGSGACATFDRTRGYQQDKIGYSADNLTIYRTQASAPQIYFTKVPTSGKSFIELTVTNGTYTSSFYCGGKKVSLNNGGKVTYQVLIDYDARSYSIYRGSTKVGGFTGLPEMDCFVHLYSNVVGNFGQYDFTVPVPVGYRPGIY